MPLFDAYMVVDWSASAAPRQVKDEIQVECLVRWLADKDAAGELGALLDAPAGLSREQLDICVEEEGWIVGA